MKQFVLFKVYTFGSNLYGQLGCGDILTKSSLQHVKLPCSAMQIAAGSSHSVILTANGEVYTFGNGHVSKLTVSTSFSTNNNKYEFFFTQFYIVYFIIITSQNDVYG